MSDHMSHTHISWPVSEEIFFSFCVGVIISSFHPNEPCMHKKKLKKKCLFNNIKEEVKLYYFVLIGVFVETSLRFLCLIKLTENAKKKKKNWFE